MPECVARPLRVNPARAWNHVVSRGHGGEALFGDDTDRRRFLGLVSTLPERFLPEVQAFVPMSNHVHHLLHYREANLSVAPHCPPLSGRIQIQLRFARWARRSQLAIATQTRVQRAMMPHCRK